MSTERFVRAPPGSYRAFQVVYLLLTLNFVIPAISYIGWPELTVATVDGLNRALGGAAMVEAGRLWHMLAVGNVMTLGFMCALLLVDLVRFYPVLPALVFLKGFSALYSLCIAGAGGPPVFYAIFVLDGVTSAVMLIFAVRARRALDGPSGGGPEVPWYAWLTLHRPREIARSLERVAAAGIVSRVPNLWQVFLGTVYMWHRLLLRTKTVGTSAQRPVRPNWRARTLCWRALRLPFLLVERAIAPFDFSGLASSPERIIRHVLAAHHDGKQMVYDLELLSLHQGALETLRDTARFVVETHSPRTRWLRDLTVFEGYHESVLELVEDACERGVQLSEADAQSPDVSLRGYLAWCARQPATPGATLRALVRGDLRFGPPEVARLGSR